MSELPEGASPATDFVRSSTPNAARIYNFLLGGKDNYQVDRDAAARILQLLPDSQNAAVHNRLFVDRVVRYLVGQIGIRQIIDIGAGLPKRHDNVHEVAQQLAPECRVVYIDNDPVVVRHGLAFLADKHVAVLESDLRTPQETMAHPDLLKLIDFSSPVAVLMLASLHFVTDAENPHAIVRLWRETMARGSYLAISHITADAVEPATSKAAQDVYAVASAPAVPRTLAAVESFFDGFELTPPGVVNINEWPVPTLQHERDQRVLLYGGVGRRW